MTFIVGNDVSEFQGQIDWNTYKNNTNFVICKASEGNGYIDKWFGNNRTQARLANLPLGFYHFCRPDLGNSPQVEADFFCKLIDGDPIKEGEILALDFEVTYNDTVNWCKAWLDEVSSHFDGIKPLVYLNQSLASSFDWSSVINAGYDLWLASYTYDPTVNTGNIGKWSFMTIQQWSDKQQVPGIQGNVDGDVFFGDINAFKAYGYKKPIPIAITPPTPIIEQPTPSQPISTPTIEPPVVVTPPMPIVSLPTVSATTMDTTIKVDNPIEPIIVPTDKPISPKSSFFAAFIEKIVDLFIRIFYGRTNTE